MYKIFLTILFILSLITIYIFVNYRYLYLPKDVNTIYVSVLGHQYEWNKEIYDKLLKLKFPDKKEIIVQQMSNPDIYIVSHFFSLEDYLLYIDENIPYITWSGESHRVKGYDKGIYNLISQKPEEENDIWYPFLQSTSFLYKDRLKNIDNRKPIQDREFLVAYIASNPVEIRENLFKILNKKYSVHGVHALGKCSNNYKIVEGGHSNLDDVYENYIFGFALENKNKKGYITEKILNVFRGGAIPIFYGDSESAEHFFNKGTYIDLKDFSNLEEASEYIFNLSNDKEKLKEIKKIPIFKNIKEMEDIDYYIKNKIENLNIK